MTMNFQGTLKSDPLKKIQEHYNLYNLTLQTCTGRQGSISFRIPMMCKVVAAPCEDPVRRDHARIRKLSWDKINPTG